MRVINYVRSNDENGNIKMMFQQQQNAKIVPDVAVMVLSIVFTTSSLTIKLTILSAFTRFTTSLTEGTHAIVLTTSTGSRLANLLRILPVSRTVSLVP